MQVQGVARTAMEALTCKESTRTALSGSNNTPAASPQTPLLNRVYWYRMLVMQKLAAAALRCRQDQRGEGRRVQLVVLGCGYDSAYQSLEGKSDQEPHVATFLVDLPPVIEKRRSLHIDSDVSAALISADLNESQHLISILIESGLDLSRPTIVLLECVLCYLRKEKVLGLLQQLSSSLEDPVLITYDPLVGVEGDLGAEKTDADFSNMLLQKFTERGAPIRFGCSSKDIHRVVFEECGFKYNVEFTVNEAVATLLNQVERSISPEAEPFDEYASLAILGGKYVVSVSTVRRDELSSLLQHISDSLATPESKDAVARIVGGIPRENITTPLPIAQQASSGDLLSIRECNISDEKAIKSLIEECFSVVSVKHKEVRKFLKSSLNRLAQDITPTTQRSKFWVIVTSSGEIVGSVGLRVSPPPKESHLEVIHLCVHPSLRTRGVGYFLLQTAIDYARCLVVTTQCKLIELSVVQDLQAAVSLYKKVGFDETNVAHIGDSCDIVYMCLNL